MISLYCKSLIQADCYCLLFEDFSKFGWISANTFTIKIFFAVNRRSLSSILIPFVCIVSYTAGSISSKTLQAFRKCPILVWHHDIKWRGAVPIFPLPHPIILYFWWCFWSVLPQFLGIHTALRLQLHSLL